MSFNAAVTIPIAFLTAYYSLHSLGQIRAGDKVLIQAAAGGVGLAALQIAKLAGAEVFETAGTTEKRELLRLLGADHVMSSRSLAFADEIKMLTGGRGVDIVLNSLAGEAIRKGIDCLAPYGRFLELGKRDIYQDNKIGLWGFRSNISFHAIDLSRVIQHRPDFVREMLQRIVGHLAKGELSALPLRPFPVSRIVEAFRYMAQARHTGKVVITMDGSPVSVERHLPAEIEIDSNARYLISGGLGGFGLKVAEWLVEKGADHLVLVGRSGAASTEAQQAVAALEAQGATVDVQCVDISDPVQTDALLAGLTREGPPLKGVFHAAMVIDDGILLQLDKERFRRAMAPKVDGCWNLHRSTIEQSLDYFVLFSSLSAVIGNPGQANYAAANAFLDAFAYYRRAHGLPALSVNWGPIVGAGYIEKNREVAESLDKRGLLGLNTARAIKILESLLAQNVTNIGVAPINWRKQGSLPPKFVRVQEQGDGVVGEERQRGHARAQILQAPPEQQAELTAHYVAQVISRTLGVAQDRLDNERPLVELGLDSLMAVELVNQLESDLDVRIPNSELMKNPSALQLNEIVMRELGVDARLGTGEIKVQELAPTRRAVRCLAAIRAEGTEAPLYCFHAADGDLAVYTPLAAVLDHEIPIYGIGSPLMEEESDPEIRDADALARFYAAEIRAHQLTGPYRLLGFSFGSLFAIKVAGLLEEQGQSVEFIGVIDGDPTWPESGDIRDEIVTDLVLSLRQHLASAAGSQVELSEDDYAGLRLLIRESMAVAPDERQRLLREWLANDEAFARRLTDSRLLQRFIVAFDRHLMLVPGMQLPTIDAGIHCWWSRSEDLTQRSEARDWSQFSRAGLQEETLDGSHWALMSPPFIEAIADGIETAVGRHQEHAATFLERRR
jgi:thioesterase domain-containing protein/NAD(P)-dependent dehydrogenase (short-subunit alcohol dehydrogenase family)/acyl carrier protein